MRSIFVTAVLLLFACNTAPEPGPVCNGCLSNGECVAGTVDWACGLDGLRCSICINGTHCSAEGTCATGAGGGADAGSPLPTITGFDLPVKEGTWWQLRTVHDDSYVFDTGNGTDHSDTTFVLKLDAPVVAYGYTWYPVERMVLSSTCSSNPGNCTPETVGVWKPWSKWAYLSFDGRRILGGTGTVGSVLFDANTGVWPATSNGTFGDFPSSTGTRRAEADGTNWQVSESNSSNDCTTVAGYGTLCGTSGISSNGAYEIWDPAVGCIESSYTGTQSGSGGSANTSTKTTLVDSSVAGDRPPPSPPASQLSCTAAPSGSCQNSGDRFCGSACCPSAYPYLCGSTTMCYATEADASAACGSACTACH
jgi:hypothetical protein